MTQPAGDNMAADAETTPAGSRDGLTPKMPDAEASGALQAATRRGVPPASLSFSDVAFDLVLPGGGTKAILEPCSGHFEAGELVAIMGPSGCGKTTLLDMLAMKKSARHRGEVFVNGRPRDRALFQRIAAYVGQEEKMPAHWRVREALEFNTRLKQKTSRGEAREMINSLLDVFGLREVAGTYIGGEGVRGISGGQRRRVMLARGVAARASLLFCDEPTSGLSATDAEICVQSLRAIAKRMGVLVLVVIHQPRQEVAELFDTLLLLTSGPGRLCYGGPMHMARGFFENLGLDVPTQANATDMMLDFVTPGTRSDASGKLVAAYDAALQPRAQAAVEAAVKSPGSTVPEMLRAAHGAEVRLSTYATPFCRQFAVLLKRQALVTFRNPAAAVLQIAMPIGMGVLYGCLFQGIGTHDFGIAHLQFIFIFLNLLSLESLPLMPLLLDQRSYMKYETSEKLYSEVAFMMTSMFVNVPLSLCGAAIQTAIIFAFSQLDDELFWPLMFWALLLFLFMDTVFSCISAVAPDANQANMLALLPLTVFTLFNGVIITKTTAPSFLVWMFHICPMVYAIEDIVLRMTNDANPLAHVILESLDYEDGNQGRGIALFLILMVIARILMCFALKFLNNLKR